jgi:hypothetical protein
VSWSWIFTRDAKSEGGFELLISRPIAKKTVFFLKKTRVGALAGVEVVGFKMTQCNRVTVRTLNSRSLKMRTIEFIMIYE